MEISTEQKLKNWIMHCVRDANDLDDIHICELLEQRNITDWVKSGILLLNKAVECKKDLKVPGLLLLCIHLQSDANRIGVNFENASEIKNELCDTPPSLYIFTKWLRLWNETPKIRLNRDLLKEQLSEFENLDKAKLFYSEYKEEGSVDYRRALWVASS
jgi:hypothetical protein